MPKLTINRFLHDILYFALAVILIPVYYYYEVFIVIPKIFSPLSALHLFHIILSIFVLFNISGNMLYGMLCDSSIAGKMFTEELTEHWRVCSVCESIAPPRSWHCSTCDICILKRDHHCSFFSTCIGHFNYRYFYMFVVYIFLAMLYCFVLNVIFIYSEIEWSYNYIFLKFIFPLAALAWDFNYESLCVLLIVFNLIIVLFTGFLTWFHGRNIIHGKVTPENKHLDNIYDFGWKNNIMDVFGKRWYLTWILPFISSPLPNDGVIWAQLEKEN